MDTRFENIDVLIAKKIAGEADTQELATIEEWLNSSTDNLQYYRESVKLFSAIDGMRQSQQVNTDDAWTKVEAKLSPKAKVIPLFGRKNMLRAAAGLFLLMWDPLESTCRHASLSIL